VGANILDLLKVQRGHFRYESGFHGEIWLDLDRLFLDPRALAPLARELAMRLAPSDLEVVVGPLAGGAFLAQMVAGELGAMFAYAEPEPSIPGEALFSVAYRLPASVVPLLRGRRAAIVDDAINAGSAVRGTVKALLEAGAKPVVAGALVVLGEAAHPFFKENGMGLVQLAQLPNPLWAPADCPLCARGTALGAF
jgi:orotate phosphoribosyltransferase